MPNQAPYIVQLLAGRALIIVGLVGLLVPYTRNVMQLPWPLEIALFMVNLIVGLLLYACRDLRRLDGYILAGIATLVFTSVSFVWSIGPGIGTSLCLLLAWELWRLLGRVRADTEREVAHG